MDLKSAGNALIPSVFEKKNPPVNKYFRQ